MRILETSRPLEDAKFLSLRDRLRAGGVTSGGRASAEEVRAEVAGVIAQVAARGDEAVLELTERFDGVQLTSQTLRVPPAAIRAARAKADKAFLALARRAAANIRRYQKSILVRAPKPLRRGGRRLAVRYTPVDRVGVYVPSGHAIYPSTVLMTVVPAQVAGVREIAFASPPGRDGEVNGLVLALAGELGVREVYRLGGAVAVAALAIGTKTIPPVCKVVGPGNAYVAEAKRQLVGRVGIDSIAGPSEVLILADDSADAGLVAADLLAQAEHDPGSAVLVTPSRRLAKAVVAAVEEQLPRLDRREAIRAALERFSAVLVVPDLEIACAVANELASEHLQIVTRCNRKVLACVRNAGAVFLGPATPVSLGDYYAGPSHVLPTGGTARFYGPLSCNDFRKATSLVEYDAQSLALDAADVVAFAAREGLTAHAEAVRRRLPAGRRR